MIFWYSGIPASCGVSGTAFTFGNTFPDSRGELMAQRILLVDDEEGIRKVLGISLTDGGYEVSTAENAEQALDIFRKEQPAIVLTDIKMPGMGGIELLQEIKTVSPDTEVIMITGHGDMELAIQSLKSDATDFITKPIDDDTLEIALKRANEKIFLKSKLREYTQNLEKLVEEKTTQLVQAERMAAVGQTVAGMAHAVKNITGGLTGGMFVLEKGIELENKQYLFQGWDMVKADVARIKNVALDLLNYAKQRAPDYKRCDPNRPAREVFDLMLPRAQACGVRLELDLDPTDSKVWLDPEGIHRCLLNLVTNAIDACTDIECSNTGRESAKVIVQSGKAEGWAVEYRVIDNGCGMNAETGEKIFQRFFTTKGSKGTGLGLMLTRKIINEHGGVVDFESERDKGTVFIVRLPDKRRSVAEKGK
jgi:signal transduction histidine kinase